MKYYITVYNFCQQKRNFHFQNMEKVLTKMEGSDAGWYEAQNDPAPFIRYMLFNCFEKNFSTKKIYSIDLNFLLSYHLNRAKSFSKFKEDDIKYVSFKI